MAERVRRSVHAIRITVFALVLALCLPLSGCGFSVYAVSPGYQEFLAGFPKQTLVPGPDLEPEQPEDPGEEEHPSLPQIDGFVPLVSRAFDYAQHFEHGSVTFASADEANYLVFDTGDVRRTTFDYAGTEVQYGKVRSSSGGKYGVRDAVTGAELLPAQYDRVEWTGDTILAVKAGTAYTYKNAVFIAQKEGFGRATLESDSLIFFGDAYYDLHFLPAIAEGCAYTDIPAEDRVPIVGKNGNYGYADASGKVVIAPRFVRAERFSEGTAVVSEEKDSTCVIDLLGNVLDGSRFNSKTELYPLYGGMRCFKRIGVIGVMDAQFRVVLQPRLLEVKYNKMFGKYLITRKDTSYAFFEVLTCDFATNERGEIIKYDEIEPMGEWFCCKTGKSYSLLSGDLRVVLTDCDRISYNGKILTVHLHGKAYYYTRETK